MNRFFIVIFLLAVISSCSQILHEEFSNKFFHIESYMIDDLAHRTNNGLIWSAEDKEYLNYLIINIKDEESFIIDRFPDFNIDYFKYNDLYIQDKITFDNLKLIVKGINDPIYHKRYCELMLLAHRINRLSKL